MSLISRTDRGFLEPLSSFFNDWDRFIPSVFADERRIVPAMNLVEKENNLEATVEVPGFPKENLKITLDGNMLTISGSKSEKIEPDHTGIRYLERRSGSFSRSFSVYSGTTVEDILAHYRDGILKIVVKKPANVRNQVFIN